MQPALQLVSKVLYSNHPMTWAVADLRRLRGQYAARGPQYKDDDESKQEDNDDSDVTEDAESEDQPTSREPSKQARKKGTEKEGADKRIQYFSCWPQFKGDLAELKPKDREWEELVALYNIGFDSTRYVCEILARTIIWDIKPRYKFGYGQDDPTTLGITVTHRVQWASTPFKIMPEIAADFIWPLLIDEYSPAEKASCSFLIAVVMLHELAVSRTRLTQILVLACLSASLICKPTPIALCPSGLCPVVGTVASASSSVAREERKLTTWNGATA